MSSIMKEPIKITREKIYTQASPKKKKVKKIGNELLIFAAT